MEMMFQFNNSIDLGQVIYLLITAAAVIGVIYTLRNDVKNIKSSMATMHEELKKISDILMMLGRQDERLNALNQRLDDAIARKEV